MTENIDCIIYRQNDEYMNVHMTQLSYDVITSFYKSKVGFLQCFYGDDQMINLHNL